MISLDDFLPDIHAQVDGVSRSLAISTLRTACHILCRESQVDSGSFGPIAVSPSVPVYTVPAPTGKQIVLVQEVWHDNHQVQPRTRFWLNENAPGWQFNEGQQANFYCGGDANVVVLTPTPNRAGELTGRAAYCPTATATTVDDVLFNDWRYVIVDGALASLFRMNREWGDKNHAVDRQLSFMDGVNDAKARALSQFTPANLVASNLTFGV